MSEATQQPSDSLTVTDRQRQLVLTLRHRDELTLPAVKHEALAAIEQALVRRLAG